jgi:hypothetical protein
MVRQSMSILYHDHDQILTTISINSDPDKQTHDQGSTQRDNVGIGDLRFGQLEILRDGFREQRRESEP